MVGVESKTNSKTYLNFHSKVKVALALLSVMMVACPPYSIMQPSYAEEPEAISSTVAPKELESGFTLLENTAEAENGAFREIYDNPILSQNEAVDHFECARFYMSRWDSELAEIELRAAIMYMPSMKVAHRDYCMVALMRGKPLRALAEFMMVVGLGEAIPLSESQRKELREEAAGAHYNKGLKFAEESKWEDAIAELLWSRKYTPLDPVVHRSLAFAYASNKEFDKAEEQYNYTLSLNPSDALAHADYAVLLSAKGKSDQALAAMNKAVQLKPEAAALHVDLGWMAESKGDLKTAASQFEYAVKVSPEHSVLWTHLGNVYKKLGNDTKAIAAYNKALALDPNLAEVKASLEALNSQNGTASDAETTGATGTATGTGTGKGKGKGKGTGTTPLKPESGFTPLKR